MDGINCDRPPPVAPPFMPNTGPSDGSLSAKMVFSLFLFIASHNPIENVVFPSPNGVGFVEVTNISFDGGCNGNLKAIAKLCDGMQADQIIKKLAGNTCGFKSTSCADQFAKALSEN